MKVKDATVRVISVSVKFIVVALVVFFLLRGAMFAYDFGYSIFMDEAAAAQGEGRDVEVTLLDGSGARDVGKQLESLGVIKDANVFYFQALIAGSSKDFKGGAYTFNTSMRPSEIMEILEEGSEAQ